MKATLSKTEQIDRIKRRIAKARRRLQPNKPKRHQLTQGNTAHEMAVVARLSARLTELTING